MVAKNKRKASRAKRKAEAEENHQKYYDRLVYKCKKELRKQVKVCKAFELKKIIRRLKDKPSAELEERMQQLKTSNDIDPVVDECFRRLGLVQLNPSFSAAKDDSAPEDESNTNTEDEKKTPQSKDTTLEPWIINKILSHKKMKDSLETWNDEVTKFRRWTLHQEERKESRSKGTPAAVRHQNRAKKEASDLSNSLFVKLGGEDDDEDDEEQNNGSKHYPDGNYGPASVGGFTAEAPKRNRRGQRARKAKALAIEARREGRTIDKSINWRPKKEKSYDDDQGGGRRDQATPAISIAPVEDTANLHPSWQAKKTQSSGIVSFQGKKITFD